MKKTYEPQRKRGEKKERRVSWCFTPSQPVRLYQGEKGRTEKEKRYLKSEVIGLHAAEVPFFF